MATVIHESGEMYLEHILNLEQELGQVRSIDISQRTGYSKPSVSRAVGLLKNAGYITVEKDGSLILTENGRKTAENIYEKHTTLTTLLKNLGVDEKIASEDACKIEHVISDVSFEAIKKLAEKIEG